jgi:hypothetical protein
MSDAAMYPWAEVGLAKKLGVNRAELRSLRNAKLKRGEDWETFGKSVQWSQLAAEMAVALFKAVMPADAEKSALASPVNQNRPSDARVTRARIANPHIVFAEVEGETGELMVRVKSNVNFRPGMRLKVEKTAQGWALAGRCPRFPGRW